MKGNRLGGSKTGLRLHDRNGEAMLLVVVGVISWLTAKDQEGRRGWSHCNTATGGVVSGLGHFPVSDGRGSPPVVVAQHLGFCYLSS